MPFVEHGPKTYNLLISLFIYFTFLRDNSKSCERILIVTVCSDKGPQGKGFVDFVTSDREL